ncbi:YhjD/YihY/BrkB family envelope integrity protein [Streptomyces sp. TLI_171]|uniref:YhjD/YihY/BrkB family envelope integrity protein n=1 Tax=Streptomyces sp. TLI_171 TaxID=1938859 RepID=UPI000C175BED|nr:YhjD/YihY/BrkB family envelope integrity protein [Streptomyces sp. TLI_171]RKE17403.1 membrane protein [Streptomyces sp. TLI_171]
MTHLPEHRRPGAGRARAAPAAVVRVCREVWRRGREIELLQRSFAFAALFFVTLVPLLVVIAAAVPGSGTGITEWITDALGLTGPGRDAVHALFASRGQVLSTTTAFGLAALAVFGISLMSAVQGVYERIWDLERGPWHAVWRQTLALAALVGYILLAAWIGTPGRGSVVQPTLAITVDSAGGVLLFWGLQRLLLAGRVPARQLLAGAVITMAALVGLRVFSRLVFAPLLVSNAVSYGTVGTVLVVQSWLIGVGWTVYAGALAGRALTRTDPRAPTTADRRP